jgi:hypothetical protein
VLTYVHFSLPAHLTSVITNIDFYFNTGFIFQAIMTSLGMRIRGSQTAKSLVGGLAAFF